MSAIEKPALTFGSTVSGSFMVHKPLDEILLNRAAEFWKERNLVIKKSVLAAPSGRDPAILKGTLAAEGGTIWTTDVEQYRKIVSVSIVGAENSLKVFFHVEFIGAFISSKDRKKIAGLFEAFQDRLSASK